MYIDSRASEATVPLVWVRDGRSVAEWGQVLKCVVDSLANDESAPDLPLEAVVLTVEFMYGRIGPEPEPFTAEEMKKLGIHVIDGAVESV